jgi:polysaccharide export outer membrane protein
MNVLLAIIPAVIRPKLQAKSVAVMLLLVWGGAVLGQAAQADQVPPRELIEYVREATKTGVSESKIQKQAAALGWPETVVDQAIAFVKSGKPLPETPTAPVAAATKTVPVASFETPREDPVAAAVGVQEKPATPPAGTGAARVGSDEYLIGAGDTLQVTVWQDAELSIPTQVVRPDGKITMPLIKEVPVAGLTERQAEATISTALRKYKTDPIVTVVVTLPTSKKIYLVGGVRKEGTIPYTYGMTVMQALSEAGGVNEYAKKTKIYILRTENGREYRLEFNYKQVLQGERMEQNIVLMPGDTVVVPQ